MLSFLRGFLPNISCISAQSHACCVSLRGVSLSLNLIWRELKKKNMEHLVMKHPLYLSFPSLSGRISKMSKYRTFYVS